MKLLLYDGSCNLCHWAVQWVKRNSNNTLFQFEAIESSFGKKILEKYPDLKKVDSIIFIDETRIYVKSEAVFRISKNLSGISYCLSYFNRLPTSITDKIYTFVANRRYRWFGQKSNCNI